MGSADGNEATELFQAQIHLYKYTGALISSMAVRCAIDLGIPDTIHSHGKPMTLAELVSALQIHPSKASHLQRFLRLLVHDGFFATTKKEEEEAVGYALTPPSKLLVRGKETCLAPVVHGSQIPPWCNALLTWKKWFHEEEESLLKVEYGMGTIDLLIQNHELLSTLIEALAADSQALRLVIKEFKPIFEGLCTIIDVGGGTGTVAKVISEAFPDLKCTVLDLPMVVANLPASKNLSFFAGNMFESIPPADAILLKNVLHDWGDEQCIKVLKNCKEAISQKGKKGKVIVIELVIDEKNDDHDLNEMKLYYDLMMMTMGIGKERNEKEWEKLFLESGFRSYKINPIFGSKSVIEVYP